MDKGNRFWNFIFCTIWIASAMRASAVGYTLTLVTQGNGTIHPNPTNSFYPPGAVVTITAAPDSSSYFGGWSGSTNSSINPLNVSMTGDLLITGSFLPYPTYSLTLVTNGQGAISINPNNANYISNTVVAATATPANGWVFADWVFAGSLGISFNPANPLSYTINSNSTLAASFGQLPAFDVQPAGVTNITGTSLDLLAHSIGTGPVTYQWFFAGNIDTGAVNSTLAIPDAQPTNSGQYWVVASNTYGTATSSVVSLLFTNSFASTNLISVCDEAGLRAAVAIGGWITIGCNGTIALSAPIDITNTIILDGSSVSAIISGGGSNRLFNVFPGAGLSITNVNLVNGSATLTNSASATNADGGAIYNNKGTVNLTSCILSNNNAQAITPGGIARGGAIFNLGGTVYLDNSIVENNFISSGSNNISGSAESSFAGGTSFGGALYNDTGVMILSNVCVVSNNISAQDYLPFQPTIYGGIGLGGAIFNTNGSLIVLDSTVSNNFCTAQAGPGSKCLGGAIFQSSGSLAISNSQVIANSSVGGPGGSAQNSFPPLAAYGGGIAALTGTISLDHVNVAGNTARSGGTGYHTASSPASGGGIYNQGNLTAEYSIFDGNSALVGSGNRIYESSADGGGGGIYNLGSIILDRTCIYSNLVQGSAGINNPGVSANGGNGLGGGIFNGGQLSVTNTTIAFNTAVAGSGSPAEFGSGTGINGNADGGGVFNDQGATFGAWNVTIASNTAVTTVNIQYNIQGLPGQIGGVEVHNYGTLSLHNSILAYSGSNSNAYGTITDDGYNISSDGSANFASGSSYNYTDPLLGTLANNGGPTLTMALLPNSPAIDFGDDANFPLTDQRGYARPAGAGVDIGAFEYGALPSNAGTWLTLLDSTNHFSMSFNAKAAVTYVWQTSTNLETWTPWLTNGPFTSPTNINQSINVTSSNGRFFRLLIQ